ATQLQSLDGDGRADDDRRGRRHRRAWRARPGLDRHTGTPRAAPGAEAVVPEPLPREAILRRVAAELRHGDYVNLGVGLPMQIPPFVDASKLVMFHAENGVIGFGPRPPEGDEDWDLFNAGFQPVTLLPGGAIVDGVDSFAIVRGR